MQKFQRKQLQETSESNFPRSLLFCYSRQVFQTGGFVSWIQEIITTFIVDFQVRNVRCVYFAAVLIGKGRDVI